MKHLLDLRGLALHSLHKGKDPDAVDGNPTPAHCLDNFTRDHLVPLVESGAPIFDIIAVREGGNAMRRAWFPAYKQHRLVNEDGARKEAVRAGHQAAVDLVHALGIPSAVSEGCEADDTVAWLAERLPGDVVVHTRDKDLIQLATMGDGKNVTVMYNGQEAWGMDDKGLDQSVEPRFVALYKSLAGDRSDGYPGVAGFGPACWNWLSESGINLEALAQVVDRGRFERLRPLFSKHHSFEKMHGQREMWQTCWRLALLHPEEVERSFHIAGEGADARYAYRRVEWVKRLPQERKIRELLDRHGALYLFDRLDAAGLVPRKTLVTAGGGTAFAELLPEIVLEGANGWVSLDFETVSPQNPAFDKAANGRNYVDVFGAEIVGAGLTWGSNAQHTAYLSFGHKGGRNLGLGTLDAVMAALPEGTPVIAANSSFERSVLKNTRGIEINSFVDTMPMISHLDEDGSFEEAVDRHYDGKDGDEEEDEDEDNPDLQYVNQDLKGNVLKHMDYRQTEYNEVVSKGMTMADLTPEEVFSYGADDPLCTAHLYFHLKTLLELEGTFAFQGEENDALCLWSDGFLDGVSIDTEKFAELQREDKAIYDEKLAAMRAALEANDDASLKDFGRAQLFDDERQEFEAKKRVGAFAQPKLTAELLEEVTRLLGLPPFRSMSAKCAMKYTGELATKAATAGGARLILALEECAARNELSDKKSGPAKQALWDLCVELEPKLIKAAIKAAVPYRPWVKKEKDFSRFEVTPGKLPAICAAFGLPPLASLKGAEVRNYTAKNFVDDGGLEYNELCAKPANKFLSLLFECAQAGQFSPKKRGADYQALRGFCLEAWKAALPDEDRYEFEGTELNLGSPKQKKYLLYGTLGLPMLVFNQKVPVTRLALGLEGGVKTDKEAIDHALAYSVAQEGDWRRTVMLDMKEAMQCKTRDSLFYKPWPLWFHPKDGQVHPGIRSCGTKTRRPAGGSPNILQLPKRGDGKKVRYCILPNRKKGHDVVGSEDFVQEELVLLAGQSQDKNMMSCYQTDPIKDIHSVTTAEFLGMDYDLFEEARYSDHKLDSYRVDRGKRTNFLNIYGGGYKKLALQSLIPEEEAKAWLASFNATYPRVKAWKSEIVAQSRKQGYLEDLYGNRIHIYDRIKGLPEGKVGGIDRQTVSKMVQGLAASIGKVTLAELWRRKVFQRYDATFYGLVYDEIVFSCHHSAFFELASEIHEVMTIEVPGLGLPMRADISVGLNFGDQHGVGRYPDKARIEETLSKLLGGKYVL